MGLNLRVFFFFDTFKVNRYLQLKSKAPHALSSNVVYEFTCSCDTNLSYIGMFTRHLGTRAREHLNLDDSHKSATKDHLRSCRQCCNGVCNVTSIKIFLRKCTTDYDTKIHEALLIKKLRPQLNKKLYAKDASFLLHLF